MIQCPHCGRDVLVFLDIPGELSEPQQQEDGRVQACYHCGTHTQQRKRRVTGGYRWECFQCGNMAKKIWREDNATGESRGIPRTLDPIVGSSSEGTE